MMKRWASRTIEAKATNSDLKNKKTDDLIAGKP